MTVSIAIAAPHPAAVAAAREIVEAGGGVIDAVLAAAAALTVVYPHQCSIGGDLIALVRSADGEVRTVLSAGAAAEAIDVEALAAAGERMPPGGPQTVTVPGVVAGWAALADRGARLDLSQILGPAVQLARGGAPVSRGLARAVQARIDAVRADPGLRALLLDAGGEPLAEGATLVQPVLADTLESVAADWSSFYTGALAERLIAGLNALGSPLSATDFATHRAELPTPLQREVNGMTWSVAPPPSQGAVLLAILDPAGDPVATARAAELRRDALLGDPRTGPVDVDALLGRAGALPDAAASGPKPAGDTVAVTVVGDDGSAVTLIQSVFQSFGSGLLDPGTGVLFHNRGSAFSLDPAHPGRLRPGARPPHTLCPVIGVGPDLLIALGCQGGRAQAWILAQLAGDVAAAEDSAEMDALLTRPRWVIGSDGLGRPGPSLLLEPGVPDEAALVASAARLGMEVVRADRPQDDAGHVQVCRLGPGGLAAASDRRADGRAEIVHEP